MKNKHIRPIPHYTGEEQWLYCEKHQITKFRAVRNKRCKSGFNFYCRECKYHADRQLEEKRSEQRKKVIVEYLGGKCMLCDYDRCYPALDCHHMFAKDKDFNISSEMRKKGAMSTIRSEVDKCALVCKNCHAEIHQKTYDKIEDLLQTWEASKKLRRPEVWDEYLSTV